MRIGAPWFALVALGAPVAAADEFGPNAASLSEAPPYALDTSAGGGGARLGIGINPAALLFDAVSFDLQLPVSESVALMPMATVFLGKDVKGGGGGVGAMLFPAPKGPLHGFYISPRLQYLSMTQKTTGVDEYGELTSTRIKATLAAVGSTFGYQFNWGFMLRVGGGAHYAAITAGGHGGELDAEGIAPELEVVLGAIF